jgi:hypothetical protein
MTVPISPDPQTGSIHLQPPSYFSPQIVNDLFPPSSQGQHFLQRFLEEACQENSSLFAESSEEVALCLPGTVALARRLGFAYDTTHRYVTLLQTLGIMQKYHCGHERFFVLRRGRYLPPPTLAADLEALIARSSQQKSRRKYLHLLREIQTRCRCLGLVWTDGRATQADALTLMQTLAGHQPGENRRELASRLQQIALLSKTLLAAAQTQPLDPSPSDGESTRSQEEASPAASASLPLDMRPHPSATTMLASSPQTSPPEPSAASAPLSSADPSADEGTFHDVTSIYSYITTFTLRSPEPLARWLAEQFEQDQTAFRKYLKLFEQAPGIARDPHVLAAAFFCTMVRLYRDGWNITARPGGFFTKRCREYDAGVPDEVESWISRYGHLSLDALLSTLQAESESACTTKSQPARSSISFAAPSQPSRSASLPAAPAWVTAPAELAPETPVVPDAFVMQEEEAWKLMESIRHNPQTCAFRLRLVVNPDSGRYALLVDATRPYGRVRQTLVYSLHDWHTRLARMERWLDLFEPTDPMLPQTGEAA